MKDVLEFLKSKFKYSCGVFIALGIFMLIFPGITLTLVSVIIGAVLIVKGISDKSGVKKDSVFSVVYIILGIIFIVNPRFVSGIIPTFLGIFLLTNGIRNISKMKSAKKANIFGSRIEYVFAWVSAVLGLIILLSPYRTAKMATKLIAIFLIYMGISDVCFSFTEKKLSAEITDADDECTPIDE